MLLPTRCSVCLMLAAMILAAVGMGRADTFVLTNGGSIEGRLLNPDESADAGYVVEVKGGGRLTLAPDLVESVAALSPAEKRYHEILPRMPQTVDGLWTMAEWCREAGLDEERAAHLEDLLKLEPDHKGARAALGYTKVDSRWVLPDEHMRSLGYVRFEGGWRLPQEIEIRQREERIADAENQWRRNVRILRSQVGKRRGPESLAQLQAIRDPLAAPALAELLNEETRPEMPMLYIDVLGRLNHPAATAALIRHSLENGDERVRDVCLDHLARRGDRGAVSAFIKALDHKDNAMVNRAAVGLARMNDPQSIVPLIDALTTKHKQLLAPPGPPGGIGASFSPGGGGGGLSMGGKPKIVEREVQNPTVLQALTVLTGTHHGFNKAAWKAWYAAQNTPPSVNLRREP
ncbi:MAG: hypothetical protein KY475_11945 [Planctomycetes bacterium]|nr:hypothetical protein [Planctomycetota bacterium]